MPCVLCVQVINCDDWSDMSMATETFWTGLMEGAEDRAMLKLKDWPPGDHFCNRLPRHHYVCVELVRAVTLRPHQAALALCFVQSTGMADLRKPCASALPACDEGGLGSPRRRKDSGAESMRKCKLVFAPHDMQPPVI